MNRKKLILSLGALLLVLAAHMNVGWQVSLNGSRLEGLFSSGCIRRAELTAKLALSDYPNIKVAIASPNTPTEIFI